MISSNFKYSRLNLKSRLNQEIHIRWSKHKENNTITHTSLDDPKSNTCACTNVRSKPTSRENTTQTKNQLEIHTSNKRAASILDKQSDVVAWRNSRRIETTSKPLSSQDQDIFLLIRILERKYKMHLTICIQSQRRRQEWRRRAIKNNLIILISYFVFFNSRINKIWSK
jgi:hypothetical protein